MYKNYCFTFLVLVYALIANVQTATSGLAEEVNIYNKVFDAPINISGGKELAFRKLYSEKPLLLALVFTRCTGVCNPFLIQLSENLQFKNDVEVMVLSFDPRDTVDDMDKMANRLGLKNKKNWTFGTTNTIEELNKSIGFKPVWDNQRSQFDHDALLVGINSDGYITKKLIGIREKKDLDILIASINNVYSPSYRLPTKNTFFSCFNYDPTTGKNTLGFGFLIIALPAILTILILVFVSIYVRSNKPKTIT